MKPNKFSYVRYSETTCAGIRKEVERCIIESKAKTEQGFLQLFYLYNRFVVRGLYKAIIVETPGCSNVYIYLKSKKHGNNMLIAQFQLIQ